VEILAILARGWDGLAKVHEASVDHRSPMASLASTI
jgi:hypothetical protein